MTLEEAAEKLIATIKEIEAAGIAVETGGGDPYQAGIDLVGLSDTLEILDPRRRHAPNHSEWEVRR